MRQAPLHPPEGGTWEPDTSKDSICFEDAKAPPLEGFGEAIPSEGFEDAMKHLHTIDYLIILVVLGITLWLGFRFSKK